MLGGGSPTAGDIRAAFVSWEARPRGEGELSARSRAKASPRGGPPTEGQKPCSGVDLLQQATSVPPFLAGGATSRRRRAFCPLKSKASPRGRGSHRRSKALLWVMLQGLGSIEEPKHSSHRFCGRRAPAAKVSFLPAREQKLRPGGGAPTKSRKLCARGRSDDSSFAQPLALFVGQAEARQDVFGVLAQLRAAGADTAGCAAEFG